MDDPAADAPTIDDFGSALDRAGHTFAVAESLTGGSLSVRFAAAADSSSWYRGGVVAYSRAVKHRLLGVPMGPVVSETAAAAMAEGVCRVLDADVSLSVTGAGGPDPQDAQPPGTVWMAVHDRTTRATHTRQVRFDGDPEQVVEATCGNAVDWLLEHWTSERSDVVNPAT
ncbi:MAG: CinA family protein [Actinomycetota bacterium]|nr:CinA family protein [Actinomycetota bacterium]